jgi:MscS family membrane protein
MASWASLLLAGIVLACSSTNPQAQLVPARPTAAASAARERPPGDPLERDTPRRALVAFSRAADRGDYALAVRYAQLSRQQQRDAEVVLQDLNELMARFLRLPLTSISDAPEGTVDDGLPLDRERIGPLKIGDEQLPIELVRVEEGGIAVWLISSETLRAIPRFHALLPPTWTQRVLPPWVAASSLFGISIVRLLYWAASLLLPLLLLRFLLPRLRAGRFQWPLALIVTLCVHLAALPSFGASLPFRVAYSRVVLALLVASLGWLAERTLTLAFHHARAGIVGADRTGARSLMLLGERLLKVLVVVVAVLVVLSLFGVDTRTALAGLGIAGFAVALGAKKTVENILGGVMLLGDQAIAIGDECRISGRHGWVEDITLRSVRIRTREQTLLSIPSGVLADASIENFSSRGRCLADDTLRISLAATSAQLRQVRDGIDLLLRQQPEVEQDTARIRLVGFGVHGVELQLYAYFATTNYARFLAAREELLLQVATVVEAAGCTFAAPYGPAVHPVDRALPAAV